MCRIRFIAECELDVNVWKSTKQMLTFDELIFGEQARVEERLVQIETLLLRHQVMSPLRPSWRGNQLIV